MALQRLRAHSCMTLLVVLICASLTLQLPIESSDEVRLEGTRHDAVEEARVMWNRFKQFRRKITPPSRRAKRSLGATDDPVPPTEDTTVDAPQIMLDIYRNLSTTNAHTQANTIRSLKVQAHHPVCGHYNFSLSSLHSREFILSVQLILHIKHTVLHESNDLPYFVVIERLKHSHKPERVHTQQVSATRRGPIAFTIVPNLNTWVQHMENHPSMKYALQVSVYDSEAAFLDKDPALSCDSGPLQFHYTKSNDELEPLLVIDSFDPESENIDYSLLTASIPAPTIAQRSNSRRSADTTGQPGYNPSCERNDLQVRREDLNSIKLIRGHSIKLPTSYNAGICGGQCEISFPNGPLHATLIHVLIGRNSFEEHGYTFKQCCAPVAYDPLDILSMSNENQVVKITRLKNMIITRCECIDIVQFS